MVDLLEWRAIHFSLMEEFKILGSGITGTVVNTYGPSSFPRKHAFVHHLRWLDALAKEGRWIVGGDFNLITTLRENKWGRRVLDKYQEEFREILTHFP